MKKYIFSLLILIFQNGFSQFDDQITGEQAIEAAYNINNAAVRIIKDYVYMNMKANGASKNIDNSFSNSEDALLILELYSESHPEIKPELKKIITMRKKTRMMFLQKPKKEKIKTALEKLETLKGISGQLIQKINDIENIKSNEAKESARKMVFIAQQLAFMQALIFMGEDKEKLEQKIKGLENQFEANLKTLSSKTGNNKDAGFQLNLLQSDWKMYKKIAAKKNQRFINTIYTLLDKISDKAENIAKVL